MITPTAIEYHLSITHEGTALYINKGSIRFDNAGDALAYLVVLLGYDDIDQRANTILDTVADRLRDEVTK